MLASSLTCFLPPLTVCLLPFTLMHARKKKLEQKKLLEREVPFWFRETQLKPYQKAYRIVDDGENSYTRWEKSVMSSCVCTVGTRYADVAAQLFTAKVRLAQPQPVFFSSCPVISGTHCGDYFLDGRFNNTQRRSFLGHDAAAVSKCF